MHTTLVPDFRAQVMAVNRVERLLRKSTQALDGAGVPYAVIGGNAVASWISTVDEGAVRATKDVGLLLRRRDLPPAAEALGSVGLVLHEIHGITMFLTRRNPNPKTGVHIVFAGEKIRPAARPSPKVDDSVRAKTGFRVLDLASLVAMKLEAFRRVDQVHIEDLIGAGLVDESLAAELPANLRKRLQEIQRTYREPTETA